MTQLPQPTETRLPGVMLKAIEFDDRQQRRQREPETAPLHHADDLLGPTTGKYREKQQEHADIEQALGFARRIVGIGPHQADDAPDSQRGNHQAHPALLAPDLLETLARRPGKDHGRQPEKQGQPLLINLVGRREGNRQQKPKQPETHPYLRPTTCLHHPLLNMFNPPSRHG